MFEHTWLTGSYNSPSAGLERPFAGAEKHMFSMLVKMPFHFLSFQIFILGFAILFLLGGNAYAGLDEEHNVLDYHSPAAATQSSPYIDFSALPAISEHLLAMQAQNHPPAIMPPHEQMIGSSVTAFMDRSGSSEGLSSLPVDVPSSSLPSGRPPRPPAKAPTPDPSVALPSLRESSVPREEYWHIWRDFRYKLDRLRVNPGSLKLSQPLEDVRHVHLEFLQRQLQLQTNAKRAIFLTPDLEHKDRIVAVPIQSQQFTSTVLELHPTDTVGWAILRVKPHPRPAIWWLSYALLQVPDRDVLENVLENGKRVRTLEHFLKPPA